MITTMLNKTLKTIARGAVTVAIAIGLIAAIEVSPILMAIAAVAMVGGATTEVFVVKH